MRHQACVLLQSTHTVLYSCDDSDYSPDMQLALRQIVLLCFHLYLSTLVAVLTLVAVAVRVSIFGAIFKLVSIYPPCLSAKLIHY